MKELQGKGVFGGYAEGTLLFFKRTKKAPSSHGGQNPENEKKRFEKAKDLAKKELDTLYEKARRQAGEEEGQVFAIHKMMLDDTDLLAEVGEELALGVTAEYAVHAAIESLAELLTSSGDDYMRERAADVRDVGERLIRLLTGSTNEFVLPDKGGIILCADDLTPSETVGLDGEKIVAFVTAKGSPSSHTAILARSMGIPALLGVGEVLFTLTEGEAAFVDAETGKLLVAPDGDTLTKLRKKREEDQEKKRAAESARGKKVFTRSGRPLLLYANIGSGKEALGALQADAEGIGLFRSEFLYLGRRTPPNEEEQLAAYKEALLAMKGKRVIIRTLDIGADKQVDYLALKREENPALGVRGIRLCLNQPTLFLTQLRALLQASVFGKLAILLPMITAEKEILQAKEALRRAASSLRAEGKAYSDSVEIGVMIETPAAALISDTLAKKVDFFSVGTNDLSQYTLAIDRQNAEASAYYDAHHEAVLKLIEMSAENAHKNGIWIGICGELAADLSLTERFLDMEIDELSVAPASLLTLRHKILSLGKAPLHQPL